MSSTWQLWTGALMLSFAPVFVKLMPHLGPTAIGFYRCGVAAVMLAPFTPWPIAGWPRDLRRRFFMLTLLGGLIFAVDLFVWHRSVLYAGAGIGTILGNTQVFYLGAIGIFVLGERPSLRFLAAILLAVVGTLLLVSPSIAPGVGSLYWRGVAYGVATGIVYAAYVLTLRTVEKLGASGTLTFRLMAISASTALWLLPVGLVEGTLHLPAASDWPALLLLSGVVQILGWFLITRNLPRVPMSRVGLLLLTQPVGATLWGVLFFRETLGTSQIAGAVLTLAALYLGNTRVNRPATVSDKA